MANTTYVELFDLMLMRLKDWKLDALYASSEADFNNYLQGFLILAIPDFSNCTQDLENRNDATGTFNIELTTENKVILSLLMVKKWLDKEIRDVKQMHIFIKDRDFDHYAESNNLKAKQEYATAMAEEIDNRLVRYGYKNTDWESWLTGTFFTV